MDSPQENESISCIKFNKELFESLNISYSTSNTMVILWNRFQIYVYEDFTFEYSTLTLTSEFQICYLTMANYLILCHDYNGNIYNITLKFKNPSLKRVRSSFQLKDENVLVFVPVENKNVLCLKYTDSYTLCMNEINSEFSVRHKVELKYNGRWPLPEPNQENCLLACHILEDDEKKSLKNIFQHSSLEADTAWLVILSLDRLTVHGCLFTPKSSETEVTLVKLYTCPSEICKIDVIKRDNLYVLIGLKMGTFIRLPLNKTSSGPDVMHLNTALYKYTCFGDNLIYTDGMTMWKLQHIFSENTVFEKLVPKLTKDFIRFGDQLICTTYTDLIYQLSIDDEKNFIKWEPSEEYCAAERLLNNTEYVYKIMDEITKSNHLSKTINKESNYITALALSKRQDIIDKVLKYSVIVYDFYEDVLKEIPDLILTEEMSNYFKVNSYQILVKIVSLSLQHIFNNMLSNIFSDVKIHVTLSTDVMLLKTTSIKMKKTLNKANILLPFEVKDENVSEINVNVKLVLNIPGAFDENQRLWITFYNRSITLHPENFVRVPSATSSHAVCLLKGEPESTEDQILKGVGSQYGTSFKITNILRDHSNAVEYTVYGNLPDNYVDIFKNNSIIKGMEHLNQKKCAYILEQLQTDEFLNTISSINFQLFKSYVRLEIVNSNNSDVSKPVLKVTSINLIIAFHMRNFISVLIRNMLTDFENKKKYVSNSLYTIVENLQREIKAIQLNNKSFEEFKIVSEQFEKDVIGALPL